LKIDSLKDGISTLTKLKKIAVPNPKNAPYGRAAFEVLKNIGLLEKLKNRLVYGESVSQSTQYIYKRLVDAGFTSKSVVLSPKMSGRGVWIEIDSSLHSPISQGVVLLKKGQENGKATLFYRFLFSEKAKQIFKKYGYKVK